MRKRNESEKVQANLESCSKYARYYFVYIVGIYGKNLGSQSYPQCTQSRYIFPLRLLKSYRQMFQPEAEVMNKNYYATLCIEYLKGEAFLKNLRS
jgi:hypothetical protein